MLARFIVILINLGLLGLMGWGACQQITIHKEISRVMAEVHENIRLAHQLTVVTNEQLSPVRETAAIVEEMNAKLDNTVNLLSSMNKSLANVQASELDIIQGMDRLNKNTTLVMNRLGNISRTNELFLAPATRTAEQIRNKYALFEELYDMTGITIQEMAKLNRKFALLGKIPVP